MDEKNITNEQHWMLLVLLLKQIAKKKKIKRDQLAEATGMHASNISRIFSLQYNVTLSNFISIAQAVGVNFFFEDKNGDLAKAFEAAMDELGRRPDKLPKN